MFCFFTKNLVNVKLSELHKNLMSRIEFQTKKNNQINLPQNYKTAIGAFLWKKDIVFINLVIGIFGM